MKKPERIVMDNLAFASALSLASKIRHKEISAVELLDFYLQRVEKYNPDLNAVILIQREKAQQRAKAADTALARGEVWGPLHGLPMTIKERFDWVGSPSTWGNPVYKDNYPKRDALAVERLESAGAVIFGKTNVPLMLADWQSFNDIYGTTNNPWDLSRVPGGSSGGAAAALAAGLTGLELGSDIGASIRNPAHYCGVFGHKPTYGIVPKKGTLLPGVYASGDIAVNGPLARSAEDLDVTLAIIAGAEGEDGNGWRLNLPIPRKRSLHEYKVAVMLTSPCCAQDDELTDQLQYAVDLLARAGLQVNDTARPAVDLQRSHNIYLMLLRATTGTGLSDQKFGQHLANAATRAADDLSYRAIVDRAVTLYHRDWWQLHNEREKMRLAWADFFQEYDLFLCPTAASTAFPHDHAGERPERTIAINGRRELTTDQLFWAGIGGLVYLPASVAPVGLTRSALPCGLQIIGANLQDRTCIEFARHLGQELGGFSPPPGYQ
ncbi:MAG TPA: amidase [Verrucomicrobiae bacterium]|jgi:amidase|nr:amidase [Verrucomicrobiae bacterium]